MPYNFDRKNWAKMFGSYLHCFVYAFWWTQKNSFTPLNCWVTKLTLRWLLSLKRPLTSIRSGKVGEIQCSMTKVVFVLDFWLWEYFAERRRFLSCRAGCCSQWSDRGTGRQNGGIATDALARSIHNRVSRLISPKKVDLLLNADIYYSISEYYLARYFLFHL